MQIEKINHFLQQVAQNNNRPWFQAHKDEYLMCHKDFEKGIAEAINRIALFDKEVEHLSAKDCIYRFYRDTRFSQDKSPYKRHFGAYICSRGRKSLRGGYYIHVEPGNCMLAIGCYWLPTNILTACRNEIMGNIDQWQEAVNNEHFISLFGTPGCGKWEESEHGFGLEQLKTCPTGFPRDYEHIDYLRMKDYCCWRRVDDLFFDGNDWFDKANDIFKVAKPMMDFINAVVDDYI